MEDINCDFMQVINIKKNKYIDNTILNFKTKLKISVQRTK